jgi:hypothetical protein
MPAFGFTLNVGATTTEFNFDPFGNLVSGRPFSVIVRSDELRAPLIDSTSGAWFG